MEDLIKGTGSLCMMDIFTFQDLRIQITTFNVSQKKPEDVNLNLLAGLPDTTEEATNPPDFIVIGLQELKSQACDLVLSAMFNDPWTNALSGSLSSFGYVRVKTARLLTMGLTFYCLQKHLHQLRRIECGYTRTGANGLWGNKGGIAFRLKIYGAKICFVSSHLAAHENHLKDRIEDYHSIVDSIKFNSRGSTTIFQHDYIFWCGDLNFRLCESCSFTAEEVESELMNGNIHRLLEMDQLKAAQKSGQAFSELTEPQINFRPTFKYLVGSTQYNLMRRPAWCDRILYTVNYKKSKKKQFCIKVENYEAIESISVSDHKPVTALFTIKVFQNFKDKSVEFLPISTWYRNMYNSVAVSFNSQFTPSKSDSIAIFYNNFSSMDDPCLRKDVIELIDDEETFESLQPGEQLNLVFSEEDIFKLEPTNYVLVYLTDEGDIMGISHPFDLKPCEEESERRGSYRPLDV